MSVQGPSSLPFRPFVPAAPASSRAASGAAARSASSPAAPAAEAPAESSLWELLTADEREFFAQQASLGALTYGRSRAAAAGGAPANAAPIGQRLDVRG
jgi:hypothetical protein